MEEFVMKNQKKLRCGITTGTCAAAAAKAAASLLCRGERRETVGILTPRGIHVEVGVTYLEEGPGFVLCSVEKDSGDDPDVTNHAQILARVEWMETPPPPFSFHMDGMPALFLDGGVGIGRVTSVGMEQSVGQAAINTVPRSMIFHAVKEECGDEEGTPPLLITISMPQGEELAKKTFNPRLGIVGGLSILGTSGILEPMSERAILDTIEVELRQLRALGESILLVTPGNYGQGYAAKRLGLGGKRSVKCSNYIGETLDLAVSYGFEGVLLVGNFGKLAKLAAGVFNTHSKVADCRQETVAAHAALAGADASVIEGLMGCINTDQMLDLLEKEGLRETVLHSICGKIQERLDGRVGDALRAGVILFSEKYGYLGETLRASRLLEQVREDGE